MPGSSSGSTSTRAGLNLESIELPFLDDENGPSLFKALFKGADELYGSGTAQAYYNQFLALLENRFNKAPSEYRAIGGTLCSERNISFVDLQNIAAAVCAELSSGEMFSLAGLAQSLVDRDLATRDPSSLPLVQQLVFAVLGWISMFIVPSEKFVEGNLVIQVRSGSLNSRRLDTWVRPEQVITTITGSLRDVLRDFSNDGRGPLWCIGGTPMLTQINMLQATNLNYFVLAKLGGLRIVWVDSVCMHLELNRREKALMMFQHPSICVLMCLAGDRGMFLDSFFHHYFFQEQDLPDSLGPSPAASFYREVLLTYRLIFGQHKRSWRLCGSEGGLKSQKSWRAPWRGWFAWNPMCREKPVAEAATSDLAEAEDSLLRKLCCADCTHEPLYDEIGAADVRSVYSAQTDFPFFGDRLIALQEYVRLLEPMDLRALYYDRRDLSKFMSVWTAIVLGAMTLVLATLGVLLAAGQIATAFKPD